MDRGAAKEAIRPDDNANPDEPSTDFYNQQKPDFHLHDESPQVCDTDQGTFLSKTDYSNM